MTKALWLSRHALTGEQLDTLPIQALGHDEIVTVNATFPAHSTDAVEMIRALAREQGADVVLAVLPAHIAAAFARQAVRHRRRSRVFVPVAIPQPAGDDGKPRPFAHSHWEEC